MKRSGDVIDEGFMERNFGPLFAAPVAQAVKTPPWREGLRPSRDEAAVAEIIWRHQGRKQPVSIARIAEATGLNERSVKGVVEALVVQHHLRIGGKREEPVGYFVVCDAEDLDTATRPFRNQILAMWRRLRVLEAPHALRELLGQLTLEGE